MIEGLMNGGWSRSHNSFENAALLFAGLAFLLASCASNQAGIQSAVIATLDAQKAVSDSITTGVALTVAALPSDTPEPTTPPTPTDTPTASPAATVSPDCAEYMSGLHFRGAAFLSDSRLMITLTKPEPFTSKEYILIADGAEYQCTRPGASGDRLYCIGTHLPSPGLAAIELHALGNTCSFPTPLTAIPIPPKPSEEGNSGDYN